MMPLLTRSIGTTVATAVKIYIVVLLLAESTEAGTVEAGTVTTVTVDAPLYDTSTADDNGCDPAGCVGEFTRVRCFLRAQIINNAVCLLLILISGLRCIYS